MVKGEIEWDGEEEWDGDEGQQMRSVKVQVKLERGWKLVEKMVGVESESWIEMMMIIKGRRGRGWRKMKKDVWVCMGR